MGLLLLSLPIELSAGFWYDAPSSRNVPSREGCGEEEMDFYAVLDQVVDLLRSRQRATCRRTLKRQFDLDDAALEDLKEELLFTYPLLLRESQVQPLLLVFEDLHWLDAETQALLDSLVGSLPTARLLLLVNYRPEYQHGWGSKTYYAQLRLDPLPPASAAEVLAALLGDDASLVPLTQLLMARTEGNPFFLEESVRTLVEAGTLVGARGVYRLAHALTTIQVPATVQAVLAAHIDRSMEMTFWLPQAEVVLAQVEAR